MAVVVDSWSITAEQPAHITIVDELGLGLQPCGDKAWGVEADLIAESRVK